MADSGVWVLQDWQWDQHRMLARPTDGKASLAESEVQQQRQASGPAGSPTLLQQRDSPDGSGARPAPNVSGAQHSSSRELNSSSPYGTTPSASARPEKSLSSSKSQGPAAGAAPPSSARRSRMVCQVEGCGADLGGLKEYHQRYKICAHHLKVCSPP